MEYGKAYGYFLNREGGTKGLLFATLALLIPVVGSIVVMGYQAEVAEDLERDPDTRDHDPFSFDHFTRYLSRGVWPFVMGLIVQAITMLVVAVGVVAAAGVGLASQNFWVGYAAYFVVAMPLAVGLSVASIPLMLHVQLAGKLRVGAAFAFAPRFLGKVWGQALVSFFVSSILSGAVVALGYAACCVGVLPAIVVIAMAQQSLSVQLYRLYLAEGGEPIGSAAELAEYGGDED